MVRCGHCGRYHESVGIVRACAEGLVAACHWAVQREKGWTDQETGEAEYWTVVEDCGADALVTADGWRCAAGHEHVNAEARQAQGWDYAADFGEAVLLARVGVEPRTMAGAAVIGEASFR